MSTILKALRRLEEDRPPHSSTDPASASRRAANDPERAGAPPADRGLADPLRERILAEEDAALAGASGLSGAPDRPPLFAVFARQKIAFATASVLLLAVGLIGYALSGDEIVRQAIQPGQAGRSEPLPAQLEAPANPAAHPRTAAVLAAGSTSNPRTPTALAIDPAPSSGMPTALAADSSSESDGRSLSPLPAFAVGASRAVSDEGSASGSVPLRATASSAASPASLGLAASTLSPDRALAPAIPGSASARTPLPAAPASAPALASRAAAPMRVPAEMPLAAVSPTRAAASANPVTARDATRPIELSEEVVLHTPAAAASPGARPDRWASLPETPPTRSRPRPSDTERAPAVVSARAIDPPAEPGRFRVAAGSSAASPTPNLRPAALRAPDSSPSVERIDHRGFPDVSVLRTSWHPQPDQRSVRIRLEASDEILNLHEGDAIGGLVIKEISPSSVLFAAGDVEIRRRIGQSGGG